MYGISFFIYPIMEGMTSYSEGVSPICDISLAIQLMIVLLFWEITKCAVRLFIGKTVGADNIARKECEQCQEKIAKELQAIKGVLLEVAMESGVEADKLKALTE